METNERRIGDYIYRVNKFGAQQGMRVISRIAKLGGPGLMQGLASDSAGIAAFLRGLGVNDLFELAHEFASKTEMFVLAQTAAGTQKVKHGSLGDQLDEHFADRYDDLFEFIAFAFVVNYERSINRGKASLRDRLTAILAPLQSPNTSASAGSSSASSAGGGTS